MTDFFLQIGLSNACFSLVLAIVAMAVGAKARRPHLAYLLWLLVFIKLLTPPLLKIPVVTIPGQGETAVAISDPQPGSAPAGDLRFTVHEETDASVSARIGALALRHGKEWFPPIWLLGSVVVLVWSMVRVSRFGRLLAAESEVAPQQLQTAAVKLARRLGLNTIPTIYTTSTRLSPLVWWVGGNVRIVNKSANWYVYMGREKQHLKDTAWYKFNRWLIDQFWIDVVLDLGTLSLFAVAAAKVLLIFVSR